MTPEQVLAIPPRVLTQAQREFYFSEGYILLEAIIGDEWVRKLRDATDEMVERSRKVTRSDTVFDLEPDHRPDAPRLRRVSNPTEHHPVFWEYVNRLGAARRGGRPGRPRRQVPSLEAQLQVEQGRRRGEVALRHLVLAAHQLLAADGRHLPLRLRHGAGAARRHSAEPPDRADAHASTTTPASGSAACRRATSRRSTLDKAVYLTGPAGSLTLHNCRTIHGSPRNDSDLGRPLLLYTLTSADAFPYTAEPDQAGARPDDPARQARRVRAPRPAALPDPARLVEGLHLDLLAAAARGARRRDDVAAQPAPGTLPLSTLPG